jgi:outer membrane protein
MMFYKYRYILIPAFLLLLSFNARSQGFVIAHIESDSIIPLMVNYQYAMSELQSYSINLQKQFEGKEAEMEAYYMDIISKKKTGLLAPKEEKESEAKLQEMQTKLQQFAQEMEAQLYEKEKNLLTPVYDEFNNAIKDVCKQNGYAYILDKKMILYTDGGIDATEKVKTALKL